MESMCGEPLPPSTVQAGHCGALASKVDSMAWLDCGFLRYLGTAYGRALSTDPVSPESEEAQNRKGGSFLWTGEGFCGSSGKVVVVAVVVADVWPLSKSSNWKYSDPSSSIYFHSF